MKKIKIKHHANTWAHPAPLWIKKNKCKYDRSLSLITWSQRVRVGSQLCGLRMRISGSMSRVQQPVLLNIGMGCLNATHIDTRHIACQRACVGAPQCSEWSLRDLPKPYILRWPNMVQRYRPNKHMYVQLSFYAGWPLNAKYLFICPQFYHLYHCFSSSDHRWFCKKTAPHFFMHKWL